MTAISNESSADAPVGLRSMNTDIHAAGLLSRSSVSEGDIKGTDDTMETDVGIGSSSIALSGVELLGEYQSLLDGAALKGMVGFVLIPIGSILGYANASIASFGLYALQMVFGIWGSKRNLDRMRRLAYVGSGHAGLQQQITTMKEKWKVPWLHIKTDLSVWRVEFLEAGPEYIDPTSDAYLAASATTLLTRREERLFEASWSHSFIGVVMIQELGLPGILLVIFVSATVVQLISFLWGYFYAQQCLWKIGVAAQRAKGEIGNFDTIEVSFKPLTSPEKHVLFTCPFKRRAELLRMLQDVMKEKDLSEKGVVLLDRHGEQLPRDVDEDLLSNKYLHSFQPESFPITAMLKTVKSEEDCERIGLEFGDDGTVHYVDSDSLAKKLGVQEGWRIPDEDESHKLKERNIFHEELVSTQEGGGYFIRYHKGGRPIDPQHILEWWSKTCAAQPLPVKFETHFQREFFTSMSTLAGSSSQEVLLKILNAGLKQEPGQLPQATDFVVRCFCEAVPSLWFSVSLVGLTKHSARIDETFANVFSILCSMYTIVIRTNGLLRHLCTSCKDLPTSSHGLSLMVIFKATLIFSGFTAGLVSYAMCITCSIRFIGVWTCDTGIFNIDTLSCEPQFW